MEYIDRKDSDDEYDDVGIRYCQRFSYLFIVVNDNH